MANYKLKLSFLFTQSRRRQRRMQNDGLFNCWQKLILKSQISAQFTINIGFCHPMEIVHLKKTRADKNEWKSINLR